MARKKEEKKKKLAKLANWCVKAIALFLLKRHLSTFLSTQFTTTLMVFPELYAHFPAVLVSKLICRRPVRGPSQEETHPGSAGTVVTGAH